MAFGGDLQLQQFVLADVTATGKVLGTGSYGSVIEVAMPWNNNYCMSMIH